MAEKRPAWMNIQEHHLPEMKGMELGKRYHIEAEVEAHELSTGENEYSSDYMMPGGKKPEKPPMRGRFKVHSIKIVSNDTKAAPKGKSGSTGGKKAGRY